MDWVQSQIGAPEASLRFVSGQNPRLVAVKVNLKTVLDPALRHWDPGHEELLPHGDRHMSFDI